MARYIDADVAVRMIGKHYRFRFPTQYEALEEAVAKIPTADVAEVVRCKDCKYWSELSALCARRKNAMLLGFGVNDFCSKAERVNGGE